MRKATAIIISFALVFSSLFVMLDMNVEGKAIAPSEISADTEYVEMTQVDILFYGGGGHVRATAWSPDGKYLAVGGYNPTSGDELQVYLFDNNNLYLVDSWDIGNTIDTVAWSPDGNYLVIGNYMPISGNEIDVFSFDGFFLNLIDSYDYGNVVNSVEWSPDGSFIAVAGGTPTSGDELQLLMFDGSSLTLIPSASYNNPDDLKCVSWSPDGNYLAVAGETAAQALIVFYFNGFSFSSSTVYSHGDDLYSVDWSSDGQHIAVGGAAGMGGYQFRILSFDGSTLTNIPGASYNHGMNIFSVSWSPDGKNIAYGGLTGAGSNQLGILSFDGSSTSLVDMKTYGGSVHTASWSPDSAYLAVAGDIVAPDLRVYEVGWGYIPEDDSFTILEDTDTEINVLANDAEDPGEFTIISWTNGTNCQVSLSGGNLSVLPDANWTGNDAFIYNVTDGFARPFTLNVDVTVTNTNDMHVITTANDPNGVVGEIYSVDYDLTDVDLLDTHTWSLSTNASWLWMYSDTGILTGKPTEEGIFIVQVTATDGEGNDVSTQFTLTVELDTDGDGLVNSIDPDDDDDGWLDTSDDFPLDPAEFIDTDGDGIGNNADTDDDNDGVPDIDDIDPLDPLIGLLDSDGDGIADVEDEDDDDDGWFDIIETLAGTDTLDNSSMPSDADSDGIPDFMDPDFLTTTLYNNETVYTNSTVNNTEYVNTTEYHNNTVNITSGASDADSDGDGWKDIVEILVGTDPANAADMPSDADGDGIADFMDSDFYESETPEPEVVTVTEAPIWAWIALIAVIVMGILAAIGFMRGGKPEPVENFGTDR